ncbi:glycoside hydrolase family 65 protein [Ancylomarina longa]|uniref:Glycoside hydrolase family 65 protein n=1 Tax=Ancylomarina longa TaxID=2487017 RepID=A0A434AFX3_9BACT|nr:glycosyl hydrolase family 65 protein [Ancylomarina longa]RUT73276.1 glycoside hydrolase family 65 protein [Ancylomarina longa]
MISDTWKIVDKDFKKDLKLKETLFALANGYLGVRGNFEEGVPSNITSTKGTYINAFFESEEIQYGEKLFGFPDRSQSIVNLIDAQAILIQIDDENYSLFEGEVLDYNRELDLRKGVISRTIHWKSPKGSEIKISWKRMVALTIKELFIIDLSIESINFSGKVVLRSFVDGDVSNMVSEDDPRVGTSSAKSLKVTDIFQKGISSFVCAQTVNTKFTVVCGISHLFPESFTEKVDCYKESITHTYTGDIKPGGKISFTKFAVYTDSRRHESPAKSNEEILTTSANKIFEFYAKAQEEYLKDFWEKSDVLIQGDSALQQGIRFNMYHLLQSIGKDKVSNISAKGLTGEGYEGHYFWDTEIYIFPFFLFTNPDLAKNLLEYRYSILESARKRAKEMGHTKGVLYPWRTIAGDECSPFFPAGTAQYHINADIAYSITQYFEATEDEDFLLEKGMEMLIEIARLMFEIGHFRRDGKFCIDAVTGPDEYTCIVNNNYYTNALTKNLFLKAARFHELLGKSNPEQQKIYTEKLSLQNSELQDFIKAGDNILLPFDKEMQIHPQDDSFLNKKVWDFENTPKENYPLLLNYHPLTLYRHQVCKQADTLLAHFLLDQEEELDLVINDFNYYEKITTHDSSLSTCIYSIMSNRVGQYAKAYDYFMNTARLDIDNLHHNSGDGIHTACMGGSWMSIVFGFAGMRLTNGVLSFKPHLPEKWESLVFSIQFKGRKIQCHLSKDETNFKLIEGDPIEIALFSDKLLLK